MVQLWKQLEQKWLNVLEMHLKVLQEQIIIRQNRKDYSKLDYKLKMAPWKHSVNKEISMILKSKPMLNVFKLN